MKLFQHSLVMIFLFVAVSFASIAQSSNDFLINANRQQELLHLLKQDCGSCHGLTLKGGLGPALLPQNLIGKPILFLTSTILNGRPGTAMPPWKFLLKAEEAEWLAGVLVRGELQ